MCEIDRDCDTMKKIDDFVNDFHTHGLECGNKIAELIKEIHPNAVAIIPLYRSCIVIEQSDTEKRDGIAIIHSYADPHWLGKEIDIKTLISEEFHTKFIVQGYREGPEIYFESAEPNISLR